VDHLDANPYGSTLYTTWFGAYTSSRFATVSSHYDAIVDAFQNAPVTYSCKCNKPYFAYVYPSQPYRIYVCRVFWQVSDLGRDSRAGTLIHEMSHFYVVASTDDYVYGETGAKELALTSPDEAIFNADNHEYFAEDQM
jgi:peptidyl-Lys metalloendopeptidase